MTKKQNDSESNLKRVDTKIISFIPKKPNNFFLNKYELELENLEFKLSDLEKLIQENLDKNLLDD